MTAITPFDVNIGNEAVTDLKQRIRNTRWPDAETTDDWLRACRWPMCRNWCSTGAPTTITNVWPLD